MRKHVSLFAGLEGWQVVMGLVYMANNPQNQLLMLSHTRRHSVWCAFQHCSISVWHLSCISALLISHNKKSMYSACNHLFSPQLTYPNQRRKMRLENLPVVTKQDTAVKNMINVQSYVEKCLYYWNDLTTESQMRSHWDWIELVSSYVSFVLVIWALSYALWCAVELNSTKECSSKLRSTLRTNYPFSFRSLKELFQYSNIWNKFYHFIIKLNNNWTW